MYHNYHIGPFGCTITNSSEKIVEEKTIRFVDNLGAFTMRSVDLQTQMNENMSKLVQEQNGALGTYSLADLLPKCDEDVKEAFADLLPQEKIEQLYMEQSFLLESFNKEYSIEIGEITKYDNSYVAVAYAVFDTLKLRFDFVFTEVEEDWLISGFSYEVVEGDSTQLVPCSY